MAAGNTELNSSSILPEEGESQKTQEKVFIKILKGNSLHLPQSKSVLSFVRAEFGTQVLGESPKCERDSQTGITEFNFECSFDFAINDPVVLDDFTQSPIVLTAIEVLPKEKKAKEEKTNIIGQACVDLLPFLKGQTTVSQTLALHPTTATAMQETSTNVEPTLPEIEINLSVNEQLFSAEQLKTSNLMRVCIESLYSLPESWNAAAANQYMYLVALPMPLSPQKEATVLVPSGMFRSPGEKEQSDKRKWCFAPTASGSCMYMLDRSIVKPPHQDEDGDLCGPEDVPFREEAENEKMHITWNIERRCFLSKAASETFMNRIAQHRIWPVEVFRAPIAPSGKTKGKQAEEENVISFHGIAYVDLAPLLYPGVKKIHGAFPVKPFVDSEMQEKTGRQGTIVDEAAKLISLARSNSSLMHSKAPQTKAGKIEGKTKPSAALLKASDAVADADEVRKMEGQQYADAKSYIFMEFELETSLVAKKEPAALRRKVLELIPPRPQFSKKEGGDKKAVEGFQNHIGATANQLLEEFRKMFPSSENELDPSEEAERRREFLYHLNASGKYFAMKEQLKYYVSKIVREKYLHTTQITDKETLHSFLTQLYEFLLNKMHAGLLQFLSTEEVTEIPPPVRNPEMLKIFATEAETLFDYSLAAKYYQERITAAKNAAGHWLDYGCFCLYIQDVKKAAECFKEVVSINQEHFGGLIMNGCVTTMQDDIEAAEVFFEAAAYTHHDNDIAWAILGLHYSGAQNDIMAERAFNEAARLSNPTLALKKSYVNIVSADSASHKAIAEVSIDNEIEVQVSNPSPAPEVEREKEIPEVRIPGKTEPASVYLTSLLKTAKFLICHKAIQLAERALSHELLSEGQRESALYFQLLAELQLLKGEYTEAKGNAENCLKLKHENPDAWTILGHLQFLTGQLHDAKEAYERSLAYANDAKDIHSLYLRLATIYIKEEEFDKAKQLYLRACEDSATCMTWLGVGVSSFELGEFAEAEHALNEANILDNHNSEVWAYLALVCLQQKRHLEAEQCYKFAIKTGLKDDSIIEKIQKSMKDTGFDTSMSL
eukprot:Seg6102.1 transcript_id=Seg6102.1/GoldUCD/mRNA.D3Y31 product="Cilia- and flagella-associated protein 70" protein_id=Seg6102.1/GoldUCD/D3Y31